MAKRAARLMTPQEAPRGYDDVLHVIHRIGPLRFRRLVAMILAPRWAIVHTERGNDAERNERLFWACLHGESNPGE
jgi:hypothetical protein